MYVSIVRTAITYVAVIYRERFVLVFAWKTFAKVYNLQCFCISDTMRARICITKAVEVELKRMHLIVKSAFKDELLRIRVGEAEIINLKLQKNFSCSVKEVCCIRSIRIIRLVLDHLHTYIQIIPVKEHNDMLTKQCLFSCHKSNYSCADVINRKIVPRSIRKSQM